MTLYIGILGASGIGKYHAREFAKAGCNVVSILGQTKERANQTAQNLKKEFGINTKPYSDLTEMLENEKIDAVSICTPPNTHEHFVKECLKRGLNVFCEKPLVIGKNSYAITSKLINLAQKAQKILTINTQWPGILTTLKEGGAFEGVVNNLEIYTEPGEKGKEMLVDHLPHANSILIKIVEGGVTGLKFSKKEKEELIINFHYGSCKVKYHFKHNPNRPRAVEFAFNGKKFKRKVGDKYQQSFEGPEGIINIEDPFKISIEMFIKSIINETSPLINSHDMLESAKLTDAILLEYDKKFDN